MNLSPSWIPLLVSAGHDSVHWSQVGPASAADEEIMVYARRDSRIVFTHDLDFTAILASTGATGPSVIQLREQDVDPGRIGPVVVRALAQCEAVLEQGAIVTVNLRRARVRILPLRSNEG